MLRNNFVLRRDRTVDLQVLCESVTLEPGSSAKTIYVKCNGEWPVSCSDPWFYLISKSPESVVVYCYANDTGIDKSATITFSSRDNTVTIPVYQEAKMIKLLDWDDDTVVCDGDIMTLISFMEKKDEIPAENCFYMLFYFCSQLVRAPELPYRKLKAHCYAGMFKYCSNL